MMRQGKGKENSLIRHEQSAVKQGVETRGFNIKESMQSSPVSQQKVARNGKEGKEETPILQCEIKRKKTGGHL